MSLEEEIAEIARRHGWNVELRRRHGRRIQDLVLSRGGLVLIMQVKDLSSPAGPRAVTQAKCDYDEYVKSLLREKLGVVVVPVLVSREVSAKARKRALSYGVICYSPNEVEGLLR